MVNGYDYVITLRVILCLTQSRSPKLNLSILEMVKGNLSNPKKFSHKNGLNVMTAFTNTSRHTKNRGLNLSYVIRKDTPSPEDNKNRDVQIIH